MNFKLIAAAAVGILAGFAVGFVIANSLNRNELERMRAELAAGSEGTQNTSKGTSVELSDEEIRAKIAEADKNADNFEFQKTLGMALYTYAAMKQEAGLLEDVARLLDRAHALNGDDYDVIVSLANVNFDLGQLKKEDDRNRSARELYEKALAKNGRDTRVLTDLGLTYLLANEPDPGKAVAELKKALEIDPKNPKALQYVIQALAKSGKKEEAKTYLENLREADPQNPALKDLEMRVNSPE